MAEKSFYVYILCSKENGTLYVGITNDISRRVHEHKNKMGSVFTAKYGINRLVYCEEFSSVHDAIYREKQLKKWGRVQKLLLIGHVNPEWKDLSECWW